MRKELSVSARRVSLSLLVLVLVLALRAIIDKSLLLLLRALALPVARTITTEHEVVAPPLRVELLSKEDKRVAGQLAAAADAKIPPGEVRHFSITFLDPPRTAKDLQIAFATEPGAAKAVKTALKKPEAHGGEPEVALRGGNAKFDRRFRQMEAIAGDAFVGLSLDEKEALWQQAKQAE